jgi:hypothetical protein
MSQQHAQLLLLALLAASQLSLSHGAAAAQLPGAPQSCTADILKRIDWGAGTGSFGVSSCFPGPAIALGPAVAV